MRLALGRNVCAVFVALLVIAVAIIAKIPTSLCQCNEGPKKSQTECPFAKLRQLSSSVAPVHEFTVGDLVTSSREAFKVTPPPSVTSSRAEHPTHRGQSPPGLKTV